MTEHERAPDGEWAVLPLDLLCDRLVAGPHAAVHAAVPRIRARLATIAERAPGVATDAVRQAFTAAADLLLAHLAKEENILFPALSALADAARTGGPRPPLAFPTVLHPIRLLETEHARLATALDDLQALAASHPDAASDAWRAVLADVTALGETLRAHAGLEAEVLFPRALDLDRRV
ncbi:MAG: hemerythrin domain-containing protein [Vicinamibacterales bacterium]